MMKSSVIREMMKFTQQPHVISFAGGLPAAEKFPLDALSDAWHTLFDKTRPSAFQYGPTEGQPSLRKWIGERLQVPVANVIITTGSQQGLDLLGKIFVERNRRLLVEAPTYLGALQAFSIYEPEYVTVPSDEDGIVTEAINAEDCENASFLYLVPNFQNPTGRQLSMRRRQALIEKAQAHNLLLVEDDPYGQLCYSGEQFPTLQSMDPERVVYLGSFSKVLAPGLRVGFIVAPTEILDKLVQAKQATDLHTCSVAQELVYAVVSNGSFDTHLSNIRDLYKQRCDAMMRALEINMPPEVQWTNPMGGMFIWVTLPIHVNTVDLLNAAIEKGVAFVPGGSFFAHTPSHSNTMRLSFATVNATQIEAGIKILSALVIEHINIGK
ncbi:PLP-dependent aminotransferase family protein [Glaciimonas sp. PCH181]|uniref:aminotransferase-like domain-containing protein n=1 Tax=Glaciimonas sp. PCH181 TaxID=2133943 RepID=UPI001CECB5C2|nr:PLP-dependent aminotransferase family protein [Glaciimonas sp. PCH181]